MSWHGIWVGVWVLVALAGRRVVAAADEAALRVKPPPHMGIVRAVGALLLTVGVLIASGLVFA